MEPTLYELLRGCVPADWIRPGPGREDRRLFTNSMNAPWKSERLEWAALRMASSIAETWPPLTYLISGNM